MSLPRVEIPNFDLPQNVLDILQKAKPEPNLWEFMPNAPSLTNLKKEYGHVPKEAVQSLEDFGSPHIKSFDWIIDEGLSKVIKDIPPIKFELPSKDRITLRVSDARLCSPTIASGTVGSREQRVFPTECRQRYTSYRGNFYVTLNWWINSTQQPSIEKLLGPMPIMVKVWQHGNLRL